MKYTFTDDTFIILALYLSTHKFLQQSKLTQDSQIDTLEHMEFPHSEHLALRYLVHF